MSPSPSTRSARRPRRSWFGVLRTSRSSTVSRRSTSLQRRNQRTVTSSPRSRHRSEPRTSRWRESPLRQHGRASTTSARAGSQPSCVDWSIPLPSERSSTGGFLESATILALCRARFVSASLSPSSFVCPIVSSSAGRISPLGWWSHAATETPCALVYLRIGRFVRRLPPAVPAFCAVRLQIGLQKFAHSVAYCY